MGRFSALDSDKLGNKPVLLALSCALFSLVYIVRRLSSHPSRPTYSLHHLLPSFVSGFYGAYRLGIDEDHFLDELQKKYGKVVFMPFPIRKHFVLGNDLLKRIYDGNYKKELSFTPIRLEFGGLVLNLSDKVLFDKERRIERLVFPILTKGLTTKSLIQPALERFTDEIERQLETLAIATTSQEGSITLDLVEWAFELYFEASKLGLFGLDCPGNKDVIKKDFLAFDHIFPLLASGLVPRCVQSHLPATRTGVLARNRLFNVFAEWLVKTGCSGLKEGEVVYEMSMEAISQIGEDGRPFWSPSDLGAMLVSDLWALQANGPAAACWALIFLTQISEDLKSRILEEVDSIDLSAAIDASDAPLLTSIIYETLRLQTSAYSARRSISETTFMLDGTYIKPQEDLVVVSRAIHFNEGVWGEHATVWDPQRFYDAPGSGTTKAARIHEVRAFGGGSSKVSSILYLEVVRAPSDGTVLV
jgi:cholesterol 7alpha-monooxygenase